MHLACEHGHDEILVFLFQQTQINLHQINALGKKAVDVITHLSTAELWQEMLTVQKKLLQASVLLQKNLLKKTMLIY